MFKNVALLACCLLVSIQSLGADGDVTTTTYEGSPACQNSGIMSTKLITDVCWSCLFPIRLAGVPMGNWDDVPDGAADSQPSCLCFDNLGVPEVGIQMSLWEPARLIEVVTTPYCSPTLNGTQLGGSRVMGHVGKDARDVSDTAFYHYHYFAFPLLFMLDMLTNGGCSSDGYVDLDLMYLSELDPTWNNDLLAAFLNPEAILFGNPVSQVACMGDAAKSAAGFQPSDELFFCAGSWGNLYPFSGHITSNASPPRDTSLIATRALAALHRRGIAWKTMGNDAMCGSDIWPTLPKTQYKMSMLFPLAEVSGTVSLPNNSTPNSASSGDVTSSTPTNTSNPQNRDVLYKGNHWIGESTWRWGEWRNIPGFESYGYLLWRWRDCCMR